MYVTFPLFFIQFSLSVCLQYASSKLQALEMMKRISHHITDECILERTVPYLVSLIALPVKILLEIFCEIKY